MSKVVALVVVGVFFCSGVGLVSVSSQNQEPSKEGVEFFEKKIRPILEETCMMCHGSAGKPQGGLRLDSREGMLKGGLSGQPAVVPGDLEKSMLIKAIRYADPKLQMPPVEKLKDQQIADFEEWIKMGAPDPRVKKDQQSSNNKSSNIAAAKQFWSLKPVTDPLLPEIRNKTWARTSVDHFILAKFEEKGLRPVRDVDKRALIRRATFDLTGLPPTPEEIDSFLADTSANAFAKLVDRLLASSRYGERWGRHWLDVVRYADTAGCNSDYPIQAAYRYRDYVIKSLNEDKPYDQFIREQLAGDLLQAKDDADRSDKIVATGYLALSRRFGSRNKEFNLTIDDTIDNLGKTFLGLSTSCARCHDHKFDPITANDYYALYGIFNSSRYPFPGAEIYPHSADMVPLASGKRAEDFVKWQRQLTELDDRKEQLNAEKGMAARNRAQKEKDAKAASAKVSAGEKVEKVENPGVKPPDGSDTPKAPVAPPVEARSADYDRDAINWSIPRLSTRTPEEIDAEMASVKAHIGELHERAPSIGKAYAVVDGRPANARIHRKGDPKSLGEVVPRGFLEILGGQTVTTDCTTSGRDQLANWIADSKNPLTARVMVNRIWSWHFGKGIVGTPNDFGSRGDLPVNAPLLDHLASHFVKKAYSIKAMHRLIMNSHVYQLTAGSDARNATIDAPNNFNWRFERRRLSAEEIRDAMLAVSGGLDDTPGSAHAFPPEREWRYTQHKQFFAVYPVNQRSVYLMQQRLKKHPLMEVFDGPDTNASTSARTASTTPVQALYLMNDPFVHTQSDLLAIRVGLAYEAPRERINYAYQLAFGRPPTPEELKLGGDYLLAAKMDLSETQVPTDRRKRAALASYLRVILSSNEFLYIE